MFPALNRRGSFFFSPINATVNSYRGLTVAKWITYDSGGVAAVPALVLPAAAEVALLAGRGR